MFTITPNTLRRFTLGQILLMAAMNQTEAIRKVGGGQSGLPKERYLRAA
ncbi:MAG TPA: hypothetical protein VMT53_04260 [Terriglobales bacterium]|nr:hypothetical protein [Terriglobales bacterium]